MTDCRAPRVIRYNSEDDYPEEGARDKDHSTHRGHSTGYARTGAGRRGGRAAPGETHLHGTRSQEKRGLI